MNGELTKQGYVMNRDLRARVIKELAAREDENLVIVARRLGISRRTLTDYMTADVLAAAQELRAELQAPSLEHVDRAMLAQACKGNVAAARLVYMRMAQKGQVGPLPTLDEMEAELQRLKVRETNRDKGLDDGEGAGDDAAVDSGTVGRVD